MVKLARSYRPHDGRYDDRVAVSVAATGAAAGSEAAEPLVAATIALLRTSMEGGSRGLLESSRNGTSPDSEIGL